MRIWVTQETEQASGHKTVAFRSKKEAKKYMSERLREEAKAKKEWEDGVDPWVEEFYFWGEPKLYIIKNKDDLIECINQVADFKA